jgi:hypothetical protein
LASRRSDHRRLCVDRAARLDARGLRVTLADVVLGKKVRPRALRRWCREAICLLHSPTRSLASSPLLFTIRKIGVCPRPHFCGLSACEKLMRHLHARPTLQAALPVLRQGGLYACASNAVSTNIRSEGARPAA